MFVHIVLFKVKPQVLNNGFEEFKARLETLRDLQITKDVVKQLKFGPPIWDTRTHGFNYGLYTVFETREDLERYKEDNDHKDFSKMIILPNVDDVLAYDMEPSGVAGSVMPLAKRAVSAHDVWRSDAENQGLSRVSSAYDAIPSDIQARLQSMSWRIRSNVSRGYLGHTASSNAHEMCDADFQSSNATLECVKSTYNQWGRTASVPNGALRGHGTMMPPPPPPNMMSRWSSDTETANSSFSSTVPSLSLKRSMGEDDSDAILAGAFADGDGSFGASWNAPMVPEEDSPILVDAPSVPENRPMRPLPSRAPFRPTLSLPVVSHPFTHTDTRQDMDLAEEDASEQFRHIDFSAYAANPDGF
ncbi:hypothetical protein MCAP1_003183 [Malassezia caprae]|uniref:Stress-response A/B barrel domain-containing protein n=1 Tax=Malassezia caprae TaxID=1381934 RepID=A0AAF0EAV0_9BASI|nr:hypothetical protein MCAP1_003183 [Malassezia caprae]